MLLAASDLVKVNREEVGRVAMGVETTHHGIRKLSMGATNSCACAGVSRVTNNYSVNPSTPPGIDEDYQQGSGRGL